MRLGELCAGYGGLGMAVEEVFGATTAWFSEYDAAPSKILAHHWPTVPNYGDMTAIDWAAIEPVDIISGGTPCQDLSAAGRRAGMTEGTRSNLWVQQREAVAIQRPRYVVWENVRGAYSAEASSSVEQCPGCVGDTADGRVFLRALGRVLGDLSDLGYDCQWRGLRAADVGAPHGRFRVFVLAANRDSAGRGEQRWPQPIQPEHPTTEHACPHAADTNRLGHERGGDAWDGRHGLTHHNLTPADALRGGSGGRATEPEQAGRDNAALGSGTGAAVADAESIGWGEGWAEPARIQRRPDTAERGLPTIADDSGATRRGQKPEHIPAPVGSAAESGELTSAVAWGEYEPAIRRWERTLGRPAPRPTEPTGRNGGHRLSPAFTEWMMGLPDGWVTDPAIGISRNEQLKACGNGVVPQQAMAALSDMLAAFQMMEVAA